MVLTHVVTVKPTPILAFPGLFTIEWVYSPAFLRAHRGLYEMNFITN